MVLSGQYLERSVVVGELDALYHRGTREPPCVIAAPTQLYDFGAISALRKPLLIVCAHQDSYCDRRALRPPDGARLEIIPHSDHFFGRGLTELGKTVAAWLRGDRSDYIAPPDAPEGGGVAPELELDPGDGEPLELDTDPE